MSGRICIIGGGASGLIAAISAKRAAPETEVFILERLPRAGKKILATGNGRCNFTNTEISLENYHGSDVGFAAHALNTFSSGYTIEFFKSLGVYPRFEDGGRVYPYSEQASSVLDALRFETEHLCVQIYAEREFSGVLKSGADFTVFTTGGSSFSSTAVIFAAGGRASPSLGSNGSGYAGLLTFGHKLIDPAPALVQLCTDSVEIRALQGIRAQVAATAMLRDKPIRTENGELLFTNFGFSGIAIFQLSALYAENAYDTVSFDLCPEIPPNELCKIFAERRNALSHLTMENFFSGLLNKRIGNLVCRRAGIEKLSLSVSQLCEKQITTLVAHTKALVFPVSGTNGWETAQVTSGGISTTDFDTKTMQSRLVPGLFACGEILDIFGDCGGFNLQWAWSSGFLAGKSAAERIVEMRL